MSSSSMAEEGKEQMALEINKKIHAKFFLRTLQVLPDRYEGSLDVNRMTIVYFGLAGLDVLGVLHDHLDDERRASIAAWIRRQYVVPNQHNQGRVGFRGGPFLGVPVEPSSEAASTCGDGTTTDGSLDHCHRHPYDCGHVTMTYTALCSLAILGHSNLSFLDKTAITDGLRQLAQPDGSFCSTADGSENDMRFVYCACCVSNIIDDWRGIDIDKTVAFIKSCIAYDGGIGQGPGLESHAGSTYCAVAALALMGKLDALEETTRQRLVHWLLQRQQSDNGGFNGRPHKISDTCYTFWVGAALCILEAGGLINRQKLDQFLMTTQHPIVGGFSKHPDATPDPLHAYLGLAGLSALGHPELEPIDPVLNLTWKAAQRFKSAPS